MSFHPSKYYKDKHFPLTREEAIEVICMMPFLVASSNSWLLDEMVKPRGRRAAIVRTPLIRIPFIVSVGSRSYTFEEQPFRILRYLTREQFRLAAPWAAIGGPKTFYYEISTD